VRGALAAMVGALAVLAAGCGGGSDRLSKEEFRSQGNAICDKYQQQLNALPNPTELNQIPGLVDQALGILDKEIDEFSDLKPPEDLQDEFDNLLAQTDRTKQAARDLSEAAKENDAAAVQKALDEGKAASNEADRLAGQLGLSSCNG
jgi:hypothetical protein